MAKQEKKVKRKAPPPRKVQSSDYGDMGVYINPRTDFGFKKLFQEPELLIDFLKQTLPSVKITEVRYENKEQIGEFEHERRAVFDLLCKTDSDDYVMIEMQYSPQPFFADRALFYGAHLIRKQAKRGKKWHYNLKAVYVIALLNFPLKEGTTEVVDRVALMNIETKEIFSDKLNFTFIQLTNFTKSEEELTSNFDIWIYYLKNLERYTSLPASVQGTLYEKIFKLLQVKQLNRDDMERYKKSVYDYYDVQYGFDVFEKRGEKRGIGIGKAEIIRALSKNGMPLNDISTWTGVPLDDVIHIVQNTASADVSANTIKADNYV